MRVDGMRRLHQLSPEVITKIAAGEVIERPASVVKELLENAVDAGARRIDVDIEQGGLDLIRVVDDGCGIAAEDLPLAFASHATSKLASADDLFRIGTLGFRGEAFTRLALAHPTLHLTLRHNGKDIYEIPGSSGILDRLGLFFGADVRERLYPLEARQGPVLLRGYIADPANERGNAKMQYLFVNGRWIRDRSLGHALQEAYRGLIMTGRYCTAFLFLELPPDQVDVNVHPTKAEVRFRDAQALWHFVFATVRNRLSAENFTARLRVTSTLAPSGMPLGNGEPWLAPQPVQALPSL